MTDHKYTDEQIIKACECCANADCLNCPRWSEEWTSGMCNDFLLSVRDLINRQRAEIQRLTVELDAMRGAANSYKMNYENAKAEAYKEFAERLEIALLVDGIYSVIVKNTIHRLVKEMTGGENENIQEAKDT